VWSALAVSNPVVTVKALEEGSKTSESRTAPLAFWPSERLSYAQEEAKRPRIVKSCDTSR